MQNMPERLDFESVTGLQRNRSRVRLVEMGSLPD